MTSPHPEGLGAIKAMKLAISEAGLEPADIDYINAHGTSTPANEKGKAKLSYPSSARTRQFLPPSPSQVTCWGMGAVEAAVIEAMRHSYAPKTAGTTELSEDIEADVIYGQGRDMEIRHAISNTFGFGGHNSVIAFKRWEA